MLPSPAPAPTLFSCCHKKKVSLPKIWSLHPLKRVLSTQSPVTAPPWIPGKGCVLAQAHRAMKPSEFFQLGSGWPPGPRGLSATSVEPLTPAHCFSLSLLPSWQCVPGAGSKQRLPRKSLLRHQGLRKAQSRQCVLCGLQQQPAFQS